MIKHLHETAYNISYLVKTNISSNNFNNYDMYFLIKKYLEKFNVFDIFFDRFFSVFFDVIFDVILGLQSYLCVVVSKFCPFGVLYFDVL